MEDYGLYAQIFLIAMTILPIGEMGTTQGLYYFLPRNPEKKNALLTQNLVFLISTGFLALCGLLLFRSAIAACFPNQEIYKYIPLIGGYCFFMISSSFLEASMIAENKTQLASFIIVLSQITHSVILLLVALISHNLYYVMIGILFFSFSRFLFQYFYLRREYQISICQIEYDFWKKILSFSIPLGLANMAWFLQGKLHSFIVSFLFSTSTFALYNIGTIGLPFVGIITSSASNVMTPAMARYQKDGQIDAIYGIWNSAIRKMNFFLFPIFVFFSLTAAEFIKAFFTKDYIGSIPIFRISLLGVLLSCINCGAIFTVFGKTRFMLQIAVFRLISTLIVVYVFTKMWGVLGAVSAGIFMALTIISIEFTQVSKLLKIPYFSLIQWRNNARIFLIAAISGFPIVALKEILVVSPLIFLIISFAVYLACYILSAYVSGIVEKEEWKQLKQYLSGLIGYVKPKPVVS